MEHRWQARKPVEFEVFLYHQGVPVARCDARNLSSNGIFIQPPISDLEINGSVELEFSVKEAEQNRWYRVNARVIHQSEKGTGLMFQAASSDTTIGVKKLLNAVEIASFMYS